MEVPFGRVTLFTPESLPADVLPPGQPFEVQIVPARSLKLWGQWHLPRAAAHVDLLFCPAYVAPVAYRGRYAVVMHDALVEVQPAGFSRRSIVRRRLFRRSARRAALVLAPSAASQRDLERVYQLDPARVRAIHLGVEARFGA